MAVVQKVFSCATSLAVVLALVAPAEAVKVRNLTTDVLLFSDGFEGDTPGSLPSHANPGSWSANGVLVINDASPGASEGGNYLRVLRATTGTAAVGVLSSSQETAGDIIHCEMMMYLPSLNASGNLNPTFACQVLIRPNDAIVLSSGSISAGSGDVLYYSAGHKPTGLKFIADTWQKWEIDYAVGVGTFTFKIDGNAVSGLTVNVPTSSVTQVWFTQGANNSRFFVDATAVAPPPANDTCASAQVVTNGGTYGGSTFAASADGNASCGNSGASPDVWFSYAAASSGNLTIDTCGAGFDTVVSIHSACPGSADNEVACNNDCSGGLCGAPSSCQTIPVVGGNTYLIRVAGVAGAKGAFSLHLSQPPSNDNCAAAIPVGEGTFTGSTVGSTSDGSTNCASAGSKDVYYQYTSTCTTGGVALNLCGSNFDTNLSVHAGCPATVGNTIVCNDDCTLGDAGCAPSDSCVRVAAQQGQTFLVRVSGHNAGQIGDYALNISCAPPPASTIPNDICEYATVIPPQGGSYVGDTTNALPNATTTCGQGPDVFYSYTAPSDGTLHVDMCGSSYDGMLALHGGCPATSANTVLCRDDDFCGGGIFPQSNGIIEKPMTPGENVIINVTGAGGRSGPYVLNAVFLLPGPAPANDACGNSQAVTLGQIVSGSTTNATNDGDASCGDSGTNRDVYYSFTPDLTDDYLVDMHAPFNAVVSVHTGCPASFVNQLPQACSSGAGEAKVRVSLAAGTTYRIRVSGAGSARGNFTLGITLAPPPLSGPSILVARDARIIWQDDGYEDDNVGSTPNAPLLGAMVASANVTVVNDAVPGPLDGAKYLKLLRNETAPMLTVDFSDLVAGQRMTAVFAMNVISQCPQIGLMVPEGWPTGYRQLFTFSTAGTPANQIYRYDGTQQVSTGLTFTPGQWLSVRMDYVLGSSEMTLSINEQEVTVPVWQPSGVLTHMLFASGCGGDEYYLDAAPPVNLSACGALPFDKDKDGDVDMDDFAVFQACFTGPAGAVSLECACFDRNTAGASDGFIDSTDTAAFRQCASGANVPAILSCAP